MPPTPRNQNKAAPGLHEDAKILVKPKTERPSLYRVLMLNDDYTPMMFVVHVLRTFFEKSVDDATDIMLRVHRRGLGVCGVYPFDIAETKVSLVMNLAKRHGHPLQCTMEKDDAPG